MYYPAHRPQLTGIATASVDCGVRATQMGLDWISKGKVIRSVKAIREVMGDQDTTNYDDWDRVFDELGGVTLGFSGEKTNQWARARDHMNEGGAVIWAVHYGKLRRSMPAKTGSLTFDGYHAILTIGNRRRDGVRQWRDFDSLLDGRYKGCPNGAVWAPAHKLRDAALAVGREVSGIDKVYALLLHRDPSVDGIEPGDLLPNNSITLADIIAELNEVQTTVEDTRLGRTIDALEELVGITANPEADETTPVADGVSVSEGS